MSKEAQNHYNLLKDSGELFELFDDATGEWEQDKKGFIKHYEENIKLVLEWEKDFNLDDEFDQENGEGGDYIDDSLF